MTVDLHTHTTYSDGSLTPLELLNKAEDFKLKAIAITDHDEIQANYVAANCLAGLKIEVVPGAEFSIDIDLKGMAHLHLIGLFLDINNSQLIESLSELRKARKKRAYQIIYKLNQIGIDVTNREIDLIIGEGSAGRPHVAQLLIEKNVINSVWEAFNKYLSKGKPAYVPKKKLGLKEAINLIHSAGGLAILAHPISLKHNKYNETEAFLKELKEIGLDGLEAYYASHSKNYTKFLINAAERNNLLLSGGSDFHGSTKPDTELGRGKGDLDIPDQVLINLKNALK